MLRLFTVVCAVLLCPFAMSIEVDGVLDEPEWAEAQLINRFYVVEPFLLGEPEWPTDAKVFVNDRGIYVGVISYQPMDTQHRSRSERDGSIRGDRAQVIIDFDANSTKAYSFEVSNGDSIRDAIVSDETEFNTDWDGTWSGKSAAYADRWIAEFHIPWNVAPMQKLDNDERSIGIYIGRKISYTGIKTASAPADNDRVRFISDFPVIRIPNLARSSFKAFASATASLDMVNDEESVTPSLDVFWQPDSSQQVALTINPDFGQVESDNLVVNFSPEEVFFEEKRPFFLENQSLFDVRGNNDLLMVHTRRIGAVSDTDGELADINAALKYSRTGELLDVGMFAVNEAEEDISNIDGRSFFVARAGYHKDEYRAGWLTTYTDRPGLERTALTNSLDMEYRSKGGMSLTGLVSMSDVEAINTFDGSTLDKQGVGLSGVVSQQISRNWEHQFEYLRYDSDYEVNDLGFLSRNDLQGFTYRSIKTSLPKSSIVQRNTWVFDTQVMENTNGLDLWRSVILEFDQGFRNTANWSAWAEYLSPGHDDLITRGNRIMSTDEGFEAGIDWNGKSREHFRYGLTLTYFNLPVDGKGYQLNLSNTYIFDERLSVDVALSVIDAEGWKLWDTGNAINVYNHEQFDASINVNAQLSEKQELRFRLQWLGLSAEAQYGGDIAVNGALIGDDRVVEDFSLADAALQVRYRYELGPLSNIFVVYNRGGNYQENNVSDVYGTLPDAWQGRNVDSILVKIRWLL